MKKVAFIFPGQGSQAVGMGRDFYENFPAAKEVFEEGNDLLHQDLTKLMFHGPEETLLQTRNCQIAIYLNSMAILAALRKAFPSIEPFMCAGHSLGEYSALTAARYVSFQEGLHLVKLRAEAMHEACVAHPGKMAAILGLESGVVEEIARETAGLWAANDNCPGQYVISGTEAGVAKGMELAKQRGAKRAILLPVHGAFHSGLMQSAQDKLESVLQEAFLTHSSIPIVMNVSGAIEDDLAKIRRNLILQVTSSVRWQSCIEKMKGADLFLEVGGNVLAGMNRKMGVATLSLTSPVDLEHLTKEL